MPYIVLDVTHQTEPRRGLTLAAAGEFLLSRACKHWVVKRDPQRPRLDVPEGKPLLPFALAVVPHGGTLVTIGRAYASQRNIALKQLLEAVTKYDWRNTPAEHLRVVEMTARERQYDRDLARAGRGV